MGSRNKRILLSYQTYVAQFYYILTVYPVYQIPELLGVHTLCFNNLDIFSFSYTRSLLNFYFLDHKVLRY
uniref:Uncharacterized protein n=1 Tax=Lepeophtheirus salmonis TaxID=72036 RepID=A0A0K2UGC4_LEPSM